MIKTGSDEELDKLREAFEDLPDLLASVADHLKERVTDEFSEAYDLHKQSDICADVCALCQYASAVLPSIRVPHFASSFHSPANPVRGGRRSGNIDRNEYSTRN